MLVTAGIIAREHDRHCGPIGGAKCMALQVQKSVLNVKDRAARRVNRYVAGEPQISSNQSIS
jgi:hypothetical protein